jgi:hypothetical protein
VERERAGDVEAQPGGQVVLRDGREGDVLEGAALTEGALAVVPASAHAEPSTLG